MRLPFSETEFLDVFAAYNTALWPAVVAFWIVTLGFSIALVRGRVHSLALTAFVAVHWAWEGIAYHAVFFSRINPAGWLFAVLFLVEAVAFLWLGIVRRRLSFDWGRKPRHLLAGLFIVYSLACTHSLPPSLAISIRARPHSQFLARQLFSPRRSSWRPFLPSLVGFSWRPLCGPSSVGLPRSFWV